MPWPVQHDSPVVLKVSRRLQYWLSPSQLEVRALLYACVKAVSKLLRETIG